MVQTARKKNLKKYTVQYLSRWVDNVVCCTGWQRIVLGIVWFIFAIHWPGCHGFNVVSVGIKKFEWPNWMAV